MANTTGLVLMWKCADAGSVPAPNPQTEVLLLCPSLIMIAVFPAALAVGTVVGNLLVIVAVVLNSRLARRGTSVLIVNLAIADLLVGMVVMPLGVSNIITGSKWIYGRLLCRVWISLDVICCTASIVTLCVISVDRFIGVTKPLQYVRLVTRRRMIIACFVVWASSIVVLLATVQWWSPTVSNYQCHVGDELRYVAHSTIFSFFIPLFVILGVYYKIFRVTRRRERSLLQCMSDVFAARNVRGQESHTASGIDPSSTLAAPVVFFPLRIHYGGSSTYDKDIQKQRKFYRKHKKSAKTLGIIVGAFLVCWTPFFVLYLINSYSSSEPLIPPMILEFCTWLGYVNSTLNPLIYGMTMRTFKDTFRYLLNRRFVAASRGKKFKSRHSIRRSIRKISRNNVNRAQKIHKRRRSKSSGKDGDGDDGATTPTSSSSENEGDSFTSSNVVCRSSGGPVSSLLLQKPNDKKRVTSMEMQSHHPTVTGTIYRAFHPQTMTRVSSALGCLSSPDDLHHTSDHTLGLTIENPQFREAKNVTNHYPLEDDKATLEEKPAQPPPPQTPPPQTPPPQTPPPQTPPPPPETNCQSNGKLVVVQTNGATPRVRAATFPKRQLVPASNSWMNLKLYRLLVNGRATEL